MLLKAICPLSAVSPSALLWLLSRTSEPETRLRSPLMVEVFRRESFHAVQASWRRFLRNQLQCISGGILPRAFKIASRLFERRCRVFAVPAMVGRRVKAALLAPLIDVDRDTSTDRDRADADIAIVDVPTVGSLRRSTADEFGHTSMVTRI
jgi:hypothetical protein